MTSHRQDNAGHHSKQRIAYVLPQGNDLVGHRLGVGALAFDSEHNTLFSGGRDGVIYGWEFAAENEFGRTRYRSRLQAHRHWINSIVLVNQNQALVSASSDVSVGIFKPYGESPNKSSILGLHKDYVKSVASPGRGSSWVAAGGLDHVIRLWDLGGGGAVRSIDNSDESCPEKGSIYSLYANENLVVSGGPDKIVKLFDARTEKRVTKLVGHTDNIRSILLSEDSSTLLSASSDRTVKLWSLLAGRCLTTFTMHNTSVWSLASDHPRLSVFCSGDKSGLVAKTDISHGSEPEDGLSVALCSERDGINDIVVAKSNVWTATSSSHINRWEDLDLGPGSLHYKSIQDFHALDSGKHRASKEFRDRTVPDPENASELAQKLLKSALRLCNTSTFPFPTRREFNRGSLLPQATSSVRRISLASAPGPVSALRPTPAERINGQNGLIRHVILNDKRRVLTLDTAGELMVWDLILCKAIQSLGQGDLERCALALNTTEQVPSWCAVDTRTGLLTCVLDPASCFDAEIYADELDYPIQVTFKEDHRINLGKWILCLLFNSLIEIEATRDERFRISLTAATDGVDDSLPTAVKPLDGELLSKASDFGSGAIDPSTARSPKGEANNPTVTGNAELQREISIKRSRGPERQRMDGLDDVMRIVDETVSHTQFVAKKEALDSQSDSHIRDSNREATTQETTPPTRVDENRKEVARDAAFLSARKMWMPFTQKKTARQSADITESQDRPEEPTFKDSLPARDARDARDAQRGARLIDTITEVRHYYSQSFVSKGQVTSLITPPPPHDAPSMTISESVVVLVQEEREGSTVPVDIFESQLGRMRQQNDSLRLLAPRWLGDILLRNRIEQREMGRVSFVISPMHDPLPSIIEDGEGERLTANRMLRIKKILAYIAERLQKLETVQHDLARPLLINRRVSNPEEWLELICQDQILRPDTTLNTVRTHIWKSGGDVVLYYRLAKFSSTSSAI